MQQIQVNTKGEARNPIMRAYFECKIAEGKTKIQALLCIRGHFEWYSRVL